LTEARQCLEQGRECDLLGDLLRVLILAESLDGQRFTLQEFEKLCRKYPQEGWSGHFCAMIALLLGQKELAQASNERYGTHTGAKS
jgi:hypothetical protein